MKSNLLQPKRISAKELVNQSCFLPLLLLLFFISVKSIWAQQLIAIESREVQLKEGASGSYKPWDLEKFFEMENPYTAAEALRVHAQIFGLPLVFSHL